ncbi:putative thioredoxin-like protein [Namao virus]|nr:putative thioredoxin-like protein [Namao virus]
MFCLIILTVVILIIVSIVYYYSCCTPLSYEDKKPYDSPLDDDAESLKVLLYKAEWCEYCSAFAPEWDYTIYKINKDGRYLNRIVFQTIEVPTSGKIATPFHKAPITQIPTVVVLGYKGKFEKCLFEKEFKPSDNLRLIDFICNNIKNAENSNL